MKMTEVFQEKNGPRVVATLPSEIISLDVIDGFVVATTTEHGMFLVNTCGQDDITPISSAPVRMGGNV